MALDFRPPPDWLIQDYMQRRNGPQRAAALLQGVGNIADTYSQGQMDIYNMRRQEEAAEQRRQMGQFQMAQGGYDPNNPQAYWDQYKQNQATNTRKTEADILESEAKAGYYNRANTPQANEPDTLEKILANKVNSGEITLENALKMKAQYSPSTINTGAKTDEKKKTKDDAMRNVSLKLKELSSLYKDLRDKGGIVDTKQSALNNAGARVGSSPIGQMVGSTFGTEEQSLRNKINMMRPLLMNDIRQAGSMGAKGLDSEKELEFFMKAATDPALDYQANTNAISVLNSAYGTGEQLLDVAGGENTGMENLSEEELKAIINGQ